MFRRLRRLTGIERQEWPLVLALGLVHFGVIAGFTLARTARDELFLSMLPVRLLPWFYVTLALLVAAASTLLGRLTRNLPPRTTLAWLLGVATLVFALAALMAPGARRFTAIGFYLWTGVYGLLLVSQFWTVAAEQVSPRRARHVLGLVGAGGILGGMAGGALAVALGAARPVAWLLWLNAGLHLALVPAALGLNRVPHAAVVAEPAGGYVGFRRLLRQPYVRTMALLFLAAGMASGLLDYQFKFHLQQHYAMNGGSIGVFMGKFYGAQSLVGLVLQFGLTGLLLSRFGARGASILLPTLFIAVAGTLVILPMFALVVGLRLFDATMRVSVASTAWEFLYFPLGDEVRQSARRFIEAVVNRGAEACAGVLILVVSLLAPQHPVVMSWLVVLPATAWLGGELAMNRFYVRELSRSLRRMSLNDDAHMAPMNDTALVEELREMSAHPEATRALYAIDMLARADPDDRHDWLPPLLEHPAPAVRVRGLELALDTPEVLDLVAVEELTRDADEDVRIHAAVFLYRLIPGGAVENMHDLLENPDPRVRAVALETLADHAPEAEDGALAIVAGQFLARGPADRVAVAVAAGRRPAPSRLHSILPMLLVDAATEVRSAAFAAVGQAGLADHVPFLIENLADRVHRGEALDALVKLGPPVVDALGNALLDPEMARPVRRELPRALGLIGGEPAADTLLLVLVDDDRELCREALRALNRMRTRNPRLRLPRAEISRQIRGVGAEYLDLLMYRRAAERLAAPDARRLLLRALTEAQDRALEGLFRRLALVYPPREVLVAYRALVGPQPRARAQALEYLDSILSRADKGVVLPLIDDTTLSQQVRAGAAAYGRPVVSVAEMLRELADHPDPWLRTCALYAIGAVAAPGFADLVERGRRAPDPVEAETADLTFARLAAAGVA